MAAKKKPDKVSSIKRAIDELAEEKKKIDSKVIELKLYKISDIHELKINNDTYMHNRISYSKTKVLELAANIKELAAKNEGLLGTGIIHPIMLRESNGRLERIFGATRIKALTYNKEEYIVAMNMGEVSDVMARFIRSSENLNRDDLNDYDETLSIIEQIQLACNFGSIDEVKSFIYKIKNYKAGKSSLNEKEKELYIEVSEVFRKIGKYDVITFTDRLSILNLHPLIKQAVVDDDINYTQAKFIKSKLKDEKDIKKIISILKVKNVTVSELKVLISNLLAEKNGKKSAPVKSRIDLMQQNSKILNKTKYNKLNPEIKKIIDEKIDIILKEQGSIKEILEKE